MDNCVCAHAYYSGRMAADGIPARPPRKVPLP